MSIKFIKPSSPLELKIDGTTFKFNRLSSTQRETIKRGCWEEGKLGMRSALNEAMYGDKLLEAGLSGWENFIDAETKQPVEFTEALKMEFIEYADEYTKGPMIQLLQNPGHISAIFLDAEKKG